MIKASNLTKHYGSLTAVDDLSFEVTKGEVLGFLGPNGAGKTTTMRMLAGFVRPTSGDAGINGHSVLTEPVEAKRCIGYLPEGAPAYGEMRPPEFLKFVAAVRGIHGKAAQQAISQASDKLELGSVAEQPIETLSKGFKRRVGLAQAILHDPSVLILDEPTDGLDPNQKHEVRRLINELAANKTIVVSTHILEEVDAVCTRAMIVAHGKIVADDTPRNLTARSRYHNAVSLRLSAPAQLDEVAAALTELPDVASIETDAATLTVTAFPAGSAGILNPVSSLASERSWPVEHVELEAGRLDEVFRELTRK